MRREKIHMIWLELCEIDIGSVMLLGDLVYYLDESRLAMRPASPHHHMDFLSLSFSSSPPKMDSIPCLASS